MFNLSNAKRLIFISFAFLILAMSVSAQTTTFTYQGRFTDSTLPQPTNGTYEMQFKAFDAVNAGGQTGLTITIPTVQVVSGIFTVRLDFGAAVFRESDVFLETSVRPSGSAAPFSTLAPRQQVTSAPLAIQSLNAANATLARDSMNLGAIPASQYVLTGDVRLSDDRNPLGGSANYVQNQNALPQASTDFNISGTGSANVFNSATQFNIGGNRVLSVQGSVNLFAGVNAGNANTGGNSNTFVGNFSGNANVNGVNNAFVGTDSGRNNLSNNNSFFGRSSGFANIGGASNSFFGLDAGRFNVAGNNNAFFGYSSGANNLSDNNSFFGYQAGVSNTTGSNNTMLGYNANVTATNLTFATAIGAGASVSTSNTIVLGTASISTEVPGTFKIFTLGAGGGTSLCRNAANQIATCTGGVGGNFIQNSTVLQPSSDFNISGGGTLGGTLSANTVNSATNFRIGNFPVFSTPNTTSLVAGQLSNHTISGANSTFLGYKAGAAANSFSQANTFVGSEAGETTTSGGNNAFVGNNAGFFNSSGSLNSFFGSNAGKSNTTANANSFFGYEAGLVNSSGTRNAFFGFQTGRASTVNDNSFFGYQAGTVTTGNSNSFFGSSAGAANTGGVQNTFVGASAGNTTTNGFSNSLFGSSTTTSGNENVVVGVSADASGNKNTVVGNNSGSLGSGNTIIGNSATTIGFRNHSTAIGADAQVAADNTIELGSPADTVDVPNLLTAKNITVELAVHAADVLAGFGKFDELRLTNTPLGNTPMCLDSLKRVGVCPAPFPSEGKTGTTNFAIVIKTQQAQIDLQAEQIKHQQAQIAALSEIVCSMNPAAKICR